MTRSRKAVYDPASKKMLLVEWPGASADDGVSGNPAELVAYRVMGRQLHKILAYAIEDGLEITGKTGKGLAVNSYVRIAIDEWIDAREAQKSASMAGAMKAMEIGRP